MFQFPGQDIFELDDHARDLVATWPRLFVRGMEVTQGIQYYKAEEHLSDAGDREDDNAVKLVAGKPAWVRVYVRSWVYWGDIADVTGTLEVSRRYGGNIYAHVATLSAESPGTVDAVPFIDYDVERSSLSNSLNFVIPAEMMCGRMRLRVKLETPFGLRTTKTIYIKVNLQQTLKVRGIMVGYNGPSSLASNAPNLTLPTPSLADLQATSATTLLTFPVRSQANYSSAGFITWNQPLTDQPTQPGGCSSNWLALNGAVNAQRMADGNQPGVLYYGLLANGIPMGPVIGCNTINGVSTGSAGNGVTMAHELGHACGLRHGPCGTSGPKVDANYPAYEPYDPVNTPMASIGEYGLDISNGNIKPPDIFKDLMSYCNPRWISLYHYGLLTYNSNLHPTQRCVDTHWWAEELLYDELLVNPEDWLPDPPPDPPWRNRTMQPEPLIALIGVLHAENEVEMMNVMRVEARTDTGDVVKTGLTAELVGEKGEVLSSAPVMRISGSGSGCGCGDAGHDDYPYLVQSLLKDAGPGAELRIRHGEEVVWSRRAPARPPRITHFEAKADGEKVYAEWSMRASGDVEPQYWIQWSADGGESWHALASGLHGEGAELDAGPLPGGKVLLRLFGSDGFYTAQSDPVVVEIGERPLTVSILTPREDQSFIAGRTMRLWGAAQTDRPDTGGDLKAIWLLDGEEVAEGLDVFVPAPEAGEHKLTLQVYMGDQQGEATAVFRSIEEPRQ